MVERRFVYGAKAHEAVNGRLIFGLIMLALGVLWTLDNLDLIESDRVLEWWPALLLAFGLAKLFGVGTRRHPVWGTTFTVAGLVLLAANLDFVHVRLWTLWPLALIAVGASILMRSFGTQREAAAGGDVDDRLSSFAFWSGITRKVLSHQFRGGDISAVMGGVELDLRGAEPVPEGAVIDLFVWWGGIDLTVPEDWRVLNEATAIMGGIDEKTKAPPADARHTLILRGLIVMGGVEVKN